MAAHGVDGDERAGEFKSFKQQRNGDDLVAFLFDGFLLEREALA
ncbi:hypothetical protein M2321_001702 [Rhodoblastus acidophilus]|nr:hypothetical protein [Rhodoblastus acidophilus]